MPEYQRKYTFKAKQQKRVKAEASVPTKCSILKSVN